MGGEEREEKGCAVATTLIHLDVPVNAMDQHGVGRCLQGFSIKNFK